MTYHGRSGEENVRYFYIEDGDEEGIGGLLDIECN